MRNRIMVTLVWCLLPVLVSWPVLAGPDGSSFYEESLEGFDDSGDDDAFFESAALSSSDEPGDIPETVIQPKGFLKQDVAFMPENDDPGISKVKTTVNASVEYPLTQNVSVKAGGQAYYDAAYELETRDRYKAMDPGSLEWDAELRDTWLGITLPAGWYVRLGNQIAAWGESEVFRLNDRVNPRDIRELGMTELEDARVPVLSTLVDYYNAPYRITAVAVHEENRDIKAPEQSDFDYFRSVRGQGVDITSESEPDVSFSKSDVYVKLTRFFNGGDLSLYGASAHEQEPFLAYSHMQDTVMYLRPEYGKTPSAGLSANTVWGSFLFKTEGVWLHNMPIQRNDLAAQLVSDPLSTPTGADKRDTYKLMAGFDYTGISNTTLTLEGYSQSIAGYSERYIQDEHTRVLYSSVRVEAFHSTLTIELNTLFVINTGDIISKFMLSYDVMDAVTLEGGVMAYHMDDNDSPYYPYRENDSVFTSLRLSF